MTLASRLTARWERAPLPRWTVRLRLTLVYGGLFLASGVALLAITYALVNQDISNNFSSTTNRTAAAIARAVHTHSLGFAWVAIGNAGSEAKVHVVNSGAPGSQIRTSGSGVVRTNHLNANETVRGGVAVQIPVPLPPGFKVSAKQAKLQVSILRAEDRAAQSADLHELLFDSGIALVIMALLSVLIGWLVAGRALRPLRLITTKAQDISSTNLHERIALRGPDDEMTRLGQTFDDLLARLERAFEAQRQFVANASHELRTPLARQRTLLEVAASDPDADVDSLREASAKAIAAGEEQEKLVEALLALATSERGVDDHAPFDLADVTRRVIETRRSEAARRGVRVEPSLASAPTTGSERLVERLVSNVVENALRYNDVGGWVTVSTSAGDGVAVLRVLNSGPVVPEDEIERLFEPFKRLGPDRTSREGHGLGLSIVRAVAAAHGAEVVAKSLPEGGLDVSVLFPLVLVDDRSAATGD